MDGGVWAPMQWTDEGIILSGRRHGESSLVLSLLTREHGRHAGLARGAAGPRRAGEMQPGNRVEATWRARLADHLGAYRIEPVAASGARLLDDSLALVGLQSTCALLEATLPEREAHPVLFEAMASLLETMEGSEVWPAVLVRFELGLLRELGFGLDLSACALTGAREGLAYVSPKSGRAVTAEAGAAWKERLFRLPGFLLGAQSGGLTSGDVNDGLALTGHFLEHHVLAMANKPMPDARLRLVEQFLKLATT